MRVVQEIIRHILEEMDGEAAFETEIFLEVENLERHVAGHQQRLALLAKPGLSFDFQQDFPFDQVDEGEERQDGFRHFGNVEIAFPFFFPHRKAEFVHVLLGIPIWFDFCHLILFVTNLGIIILSLHPIFKKT